MGTPPKDLRELCNGPPAQPLLGIAKGVDAERLATLHNLALVMRATKSEEAVLLSAYHDGAYRKWVQQSGAVVAPRLDLSRSTVQRARSQRGRRGAYCSSRSSGTPTAAPLRRW